MSFSNGLICTLRRARLPASSFPFPSHSTNSSRCNSIEIILSRSAPCKKFTQQCYERRPHSTLSNRIRTQMRKVPHALTIILSRDQDFKACGLLVSSFNTVTLHPEPIVSFNIKLPSSTYTAITESNRFTASIIGDAHLAKAFAQDGAFQDFPKDFVDWRVKMENGSSKELSPILKVEGSLFWMECDWLKDKSVEVGDHVIIVGRVLDSGNYVNIEGTDYAALIYSDGQYRRPGQEIPDQE